MAGWFDQVMATSENDPDGLLAWQQREAAMNQNAPFIANETGQATNYPQQGGDFQQIFRGIVGNGLATPDALLAKEQELAAAGIKVLRNAAGVAGKVQLPSGEIVDVIQSAGTGGGVSGFQWQQGPGGPTGEGGKPLPGNRYYGQPGGAQQPPGTLGSIMGGATDYGARLPALEKTPGYQFRLQQGLKGVEDSAAAKGTLLTGGAVKDLNDYAQGAASQEFDNEYRRLFGIAGLGQGAAGQMGQYGSSYGNNATGLITGAGNAQAAGTVGGANAWNSALGNIGQNTMDAYMYQRAFPQTQTATGPWGAGFTLPQTGRLPG